MLCEISPCTRRFKIVLDESRIMMHDYTMDINFLIIGIILGFSIAAPVGPIGVLCIGRTLTHGRVRGLATGFGAATADAFYGMVAALGISSISNALLGMGFWLPLLGGGFLCYLGLRTIFMAPSQIQSNGRDQSLWGSYLSTFLLTLANPMTILSFAAIFSGLGIVEVAGKTLLSGLQIVLGTFIGSALWWLILSGSVSWLQGRMGELPLQWLNRISGAVLLVYGVLAVSKAFGG
jgi:threonine/homoserine/homoserine lactone efflux protein